VADSVNMRLISKDYHETRCVDRSSCIRRRARRSRPTSLLRFQLQKSRGLVILFFSTAEVLAYERVPEEFIYPVARKILLDAVVFALIVPSTIADNFPASGPVVSGKVARLHSGQAAAPKKAPLSVKRAIWAANQLRSKPYRYGGGHKSFDDRGYDCSGTISYVLGAAGLISSPMSSTEFRNYGERGRGKWITVYAREGHTFAVIAGLRLDTTPYDHYTGKWAPRWQTIDRPPRGFDARHPVGL
jgi:cell wall-associated NlpC family hydrolase